MREGTALAFAHGLNIHFSLIEPRRDLDVFMIAPKGPGHLGALGVRQAAPACPACWRWPRTPRATPRRSASVLRRAIGGGRAGVIETTFQEECETDLFGEQVVLCGGLTRADHGRLRDPGRGRLRARDGLFRVPARGQADRRPDLRGRPGQHALLDLQHRRVRRLHPRAAGHHRRHQGRDAAHPRRHPAPGASPATGSPSARPVSPPSRPCAGATGPSTTSKRSAASCAP